MCDVCFKDFPSMAALFKHQKNPKEKCRKNICKAKRGRLAKNARNKEVRDYNANIPSTSWDADTQDLSGEGEEMEDNNPNLIIGIDGAGGMESYADVTYASENEADQENASEVRVSACC